jgi:hypothetical protein
MVTFDKQDIVILSEPTINNDAIRLRVIDSETLKGVTLVLSRRDAEFLSCKIRDEGAKITWGID